MLACCGVHAYLLVGAAAQSGPPGTWPRVGPRVGARVGPRVGPRVGRRAGPRVGPPRLAQPRHARL